MGRAFKRQKCRLACNLSSFNKEACYVALTRSLRADICPWLFRWMWLYPKIIAAWYNDRCEICLRARCGSEWMNWNAIQSRLSNWRLLGSSPSCASLSCDPHISWVPQPTSHNYFQPQWIVNAQLGPRYFDNYFKIVVKIHTSPTQWFYY